MKVTMVWKDSFENEISVTVEGHRSNLEKLVPEVRAVVRSTLNGTLPAYSSSIFKEK